MTRRFATLLFGVLTIYVQSGCYYWRPLEVYTPNSPPEILYSDPAQGVLQIELLKPIQLSSLLKTQTRVIPSSFNGLSLVQSFLVLVKQLFNKSSLVPKSTSNRRKKVGMEER